ncbi:aspartyl protease family protein [Tundrisphaera lichenicola]|uniref:aspartyl protease family protein n=1 Tax=Tundrisphaera lichenicola TaxID=2029860 RepID=UPI003EB9D6FB
METESMGRVTVEATIENLRDVWDVERGSTPPENARKLVVSDALIDTGATLLSIPRSMIHELGLSQFTTKRVKSSIGIAEVGIYDAVRLTIQGRSCTMDVMEVPDGVPVLIGQLPLEHLDFVVNLRDHTLIGNPAHGGEHMYELF